MSADRFPNYYDTSYKNLSGRASEAQSSVAVKEGEKKFFLTTGKEERLTGRAYFFQKLKAETAITPRNVHETLYNSIEADGPGGVLGGFEWYLSNGLK